MVELLSVWNRAVPGGKVVEIASIMSSYSHFVFDEIDI